MFVLNGINHIYSNRAYGVDETAALWMVIIAIMMYAGPAVVGLVYLLMREKKEVRPGVSEFEPPEEVPGPREEPRRKAA